VSTNPATGTITHTTPAGELTLAASDTGLTRVSFRARPSTADTTPTSRARWWLDQARRELDEYFAGHRTRFEVPVDLGWVAPEHRAVLDALDLVGYGETTTYGALAAALRLTEDGPRQVGAALARNPVLIVVPCHRVLGANGALTGYAGGLATKRLLLDLESRDQVPRLDLAWPAGA
jgi:methylated-DNA-[protein]-cysteine S-methyltransferase